MRSYLPLVIALAFLPLAPGHAEIEKIATVCDKGICPHWWPKLTPPAGWTHDREHSYLYNINALAPDGKSFANSETVMYANAIYKPRVPDSATLAAFIEGDHEAFKEKSPGLEIKVDKDLSTKDGTSVKTWRMEPRTDGQWERAAYFEEDEYYMVFIISSRTADGLDRSMPYFEAAVENAK